MGHALLSFNDYDKAIGAYQDSITLWQQLGHELSALEPLASLAFIAYEQHDYDDALAQLANVTPIILDKWPEGTLEPFRIYWISYKILRQCGDEQWHTVIDVANQFLQAQAQQLVNDTWRQSFLTKVSINQKIEQAWRWRNL